ALNAAQPVGTPAGTIGAGTIRIAATRDVLIQNSGDARTRAGFTAGLGGLEVTAGLDGPISGGALLDVVINGRVQLPAGGFATNNDTRDLVRLVPDLKALTPTSAVNGCVFGRPCSSGIGPELIAVLTGIEPLTLDELEGRDRLLQPMERLPLVLLQRLFDFGPLFSDVDATDPVTSGGNPALWLALPPEPKAQP
uniref:hypothetical protein n=1 Tax=Sandarakinorhabdus rubra TaxID=2672568 RepID=UPI0013DC9D56